jgi:hypothetical protein
VGQKMVKFSDLSGEFIPEDDALARIVIHEHPELGGGPVEIEVLADEALAVEQAAVAVAIVELHLPGADEPRRVAMELDAFDQLATDKPMGELLVGARPARRSVKASATSSPRPDRSGYGTLDTAGRPHKGKVTDAERQLVRDHFDEINQRLAADGQRAISLTDPEHVERYGLAELAEQRAEGSEPRRGHLSAAADPKQGAARGAAREAADTETAGQTAVAV